MAEEAPVNKMRPMMGTFVSITVFDSDETRANTAINAAFSEMERLENSLSKFSPKSEISKINKNAAKGPVKVSAATFEIIKMSVSFSKETEGAFDITIGPLMVLWGFVGNKPALPSDAQVADIMKHVGYQKLELNEKNRTIKFKTAGMEIDLGAIAKGYALDKSLDILKKQKITRAIIDIGGNLGFLGVPERGYWSVGIKDPKDPDKVSKVMKVKKGAVATSGNYEKYLEIEGRKFCHILDPRTGYPVDINDSERKSVTVGASTAVTADAFSTAAFVLGEKKSKELFRGKPLTIFYHR
ncbi:MAG: FAD:protein FMN transferase [Candidatus Omnitrophota bacterium]